jgi:hypothetical protein
MPRKTKTDPPAPIPAETDSRVRPAWLATFTKSLADVRAGQYRRVFIELDIDGQALAVSIYRCSDKLVRADFTDQKPQTTKE